ncbi:hypothetical protein HPB50_016027 [Hyalomma asiaticum]|uniref:Uncharacterized protein n=1 Tax=Hyalomma asiaticum TaxID=266040 RepID=A0ACB7T7R5_HYAAI|nr:hypothetical protein HPB50_016027 [Hyalomma asiaticum]
MPAFFSTELVSLGPYIADEVPAAGAQIDDGPQTGVHKDSMGLVAAFQSIVRKGTEPPREARHAPAALFWWGACLRARRERSAWRSTTGEPAEMDRAAEVDDPT